MKKDLLLKIITLFVVITIALSSCFITFASEVSDKQEEKNKLTQEINEAKNRLKNIQSEENTAKTELEKITEQLSEVQNELARLKEELNELEEKVEAKNKEIAKEEREIEAKNKLLRERMVALYEAGDVSFLDVLLNSTGIIDFISGYHAIQTIVEADTNLINELENKKEQLEKDKKELEEDKAKVEEVKKEQEIKNGTLTSLQESKKNEIAKLNAEEQAQQDEIDKYNEAMARVNSELAEALRRAEEDAKNDNGGGLAGLKFDGTFIWPCNNRVVTSRMKYRWGRWHKGIDIGANYESVYASASGYAYNAYDANGYGNYIMIVHGGGYVTLYGHLSVSKVSNGQYVSQGSTIAISGGRRGAPGAGSSTGPHLHFEIRKANSISSFFGNNWLDPLDYLPGGYTLAD